ncbi:MAG: cytochrome c oxidase subunit II [Leptolyngbya sp. BL-A-14]
MKLTNALLLAIFIAGLMVISRWMGQQAYSWMPGQATAEAKYVDDLFSFLVSLGTFVFLGITGVLAYAILTGRAVKGDWSDGPAIEGNSTLEILWTVVPVLLVLWIAAQSYMIYQQIDIQGLTSVVHLHLPMEESANAQTVATSKPAVETIDVTAKQWSWLFRYPDSTTSTELHLTLNQTTRLALRSQDVLHGFYVPEFRIKQDVIPNRTIDLTLTPLQAGKYRLRDSQFSGTYFALMEADVYVESPEVFQQWLAQASTRNPSPASNPALAEHSQRTRKAFSSGWVAIPPASPVIVNYSSNP